MDSIYRLCIIYAIYQRTIDKKKTKKKRFTSWWTICVFKNNFVAFYVLLFCLMHHKAVKFFYLFMATESTETATQNARRLYLMEETIFKMWAKKKKKGILYYIRGLTAYMLHPLKIYIINFIWLAFIDYTII